MRNRLLGLLLLAASLPAAALAEDAGFGIEASRFRNELRGNQAILSPGIASHMESELNRIERLPDRDQARRELRALEGEVAYARSGLTGNFTTLTGPQDGRPGVYAPSDTISSPQAWRLPEPGASWR